MFKEAGGWISGRWPYRPNVQPDETLGSYLTRAAHGTGVTPVRFVSMVWGSQRPLLYQDLDNLAPAHVAMRIGDGTGLDERAVTAMTFAALEGRLFQTHWPKGRKAWILPVSIESNDRFRAGLQYCPVCLAAGTPYFRRTWRMAFSTSCALHAVALRDRCPTCSAIVHPYRAVSLRHCFRCGGDLCKPPFEAAPEAGALAMQKACLEAIEDGWGEIGGRPVHAIAFFATMRRLATLAAIGRQSQELRDAIVASHGGDASEFERDDPRHPVEYLDVSERRRMYNLAWMLAAVWPKNFVDICRTAGVTRSVVLKDMGYVPFVLDNVLKAHLDDKPYQASEGEVAAAAAWLRRTKGLATYRDLSAHCGESRAAIYRHMDYKRVPKTPSVWRAGTVASCSVAHGISISPAAKPV